MSTVKQTKKRGAEKKNGTGSAEGGQGIVESIDGHAKSNPVLNCTMAIDLITELIVDGRIGVADSSRLNKRRKCTA